MGNIEVQLVKAFTQNPAEGNPAGVILDANELPPELMVKIAAQLGYSESAFVSASEMGDFRIRFFTPTQEMDLCGHATIAAIHALIEANRIKASTVTQETKAGLLGVECREDGLIVMTQAEPEFLDYEPDKERIARLLGLETDKITNWPIKIVSTGTPKVIVPIAKLADVLAITPNFEAMKQFCRESGAKGFYPFTTETQSYDADFHARQFNPLAGVDEDPITGIAAGALAAYVKEFDLLQRRQFIVEQGYSMGKPGRIFVDVADKVRVGGYAATFGKTAVSL